MHFFSNIDTLTLSGLSGTKRFSSATAKEEKNSIYMYLFTERNQEQHGTSYHRNQEREQSNNIN
jgi:hypothetical protein